MGHKIKVDVRLCANSGPLKEGVQFELEFPRKPGIKTIDALMADLEIRDAVQRVVEFRLVERKKKGEWTKLKDL